MYRTLANLQRHLAITILVFVALFVACAGARAMPCDASDGVAVVQPASGATDGGDADPASLPSLEDNTTNLDDTFDVPPLHVVNVPHSAPSRPRGHAPAGAAHRHALELRPPIA